jgi:hypothetical protein
MVQTGDELVRDLACWRVALSIRAEPATIPATRRPIIIRTIESSIRVKPFLFFVRFNMVLFKIV